MGPSLVDVDPVFQESMPKRKRGNVIPFPDCFSQLVMTLRNECTKGGGFRRLYAQILGFKLANLRSSDRPARANYFSLKALEIPSQLSVLSCFGRRTINQRQSGHDRDKSSDPKPNVSSVLYLRKSCCSAKRADQLGGLVYSIQESFTLEVVQRG